MNTAGWLLVAILAIPGADDSHKVELAFETLKECNVARAIVALEHAQPTGPVARALCIPMPPMDGGQSAEGNN